MLNPVKKLSRPSQEADRAAALRDNLKKRKARAATRAEKDETDDAKPEHSPIV